MKLIKQPTSWSCLPTCLAMAIGCTLEEIFEFIGHDGSELRYPLEPAPFCFRAFHMREMVDFAYSRGYLYSYIPRYAEHFIDSEGTIAQHPIKDNWQRLMLYFKGQNVIVSGDYPSPHAVLYSDGVIYDPKGFTAKPDDYLEKMMSISLITSR